MACKKIIENLVERHLLPAGWQLLKTVGLLLAVAGGIYLMELLVNCLENYEPGKHIIINFYVQTFGWGAVLVLGGIALAAGIYGSMNITKVFLCAPFWLVRFLLWGLIVEPIRIGRREKYCMPDGRKTAAAKIEERN